MKEEDIERKRKIRKRGDEKKEKKRDKQREGKEKKYTTKHDEKTNTCTVNQGMRTGDLQHRTRNRKQPISAKERENFLCPALGPGPWAAGGSHVDVLVPAHCWSPLHSSLLRLVKDAAARLPKRSALILPVDLPQAYWLSQKMSRQIVPGKSLKQTPATDETERERERKKKRHRVSSGSHFVTQLEPTRMRWKSDQVHTTTLWQRKQICGNVTVSSQCAIQHSSSAWANVVPKLSVTLTVAETKILIIAILPLHCFWR